jgi:hypothetical protein
MPRARALDDVADAQFLAAAGIERVDSGLEVGTQGSKPFDVLQQLAPDLLLIGVRQRRYLRHGVFKNLDHKRHLTTKLVRGASDGRHLVGFSGCANGLPTIGNFTP